MTSRSSGLLAYLQLFRLPNVFTAADDILMGYLIAHGAFTPAGPLALLLAASCLMYMAGMVLNDVFDVEQPPPDPVGSHPPPVRADPWSRVAGVRCRLRLDCCRAITRP
jgi:hypothetical protein